MAEAIDISDAQWQVIGAVRGRMAQDIWQFELSDVTSQTRVYKQSLHNFFRKSMAITPQNGEFEVEICIVINPNFPTIDVDNVAKAVLDGIKGHVFYDDGQIMRLLVEKTFAEDEKLIITVRQRARVC